MRKSKKRELYTYTETEVKNMCIELINSLPMKDFNIWFKSNKKRGHNPAFNKPHIRG